MAKKISNQIKSAERRRDFGEVYTNEKEVKAMFDLVGEDSYRIDAKILEPACGNGNFLIEALTRKLQTAANIPNLTGLQYGYLATVAFANLYGFDILQDNISECRQRLFGYFEAQYKERFELQEKGLFESIHYILSKNIVRADTLRLVALPDESPLIVSEWVIRDGYFMQQDFLFSSLLPPPPPPPKRGKQIHQQDLFAEVKPAKPLPITVYTPIHFLQLHKLNTINDAKTNQP